jgi:hypothetical protein
MNGDNQNNKNSSSKHSIVLILFFLIIAIVITSWLLTKSSSQKTPPSNKSFRSPSTDAGSDKQEQLDMPPAATYSDDELLETLKVISGEFWYGIYVGRHKIGYANHINRKVTVKADGKDYYLFKKEDIFKYKTNEDEVLENRITEIFFESLAPFTLHRYSFLTVKGKQISSGHIITHENGKYKIRQINNGSHSDEYLDLPEYTMKDYLALELWVTTSDLQENDAICHKYLDANALKVKTLSSVLNSIRTRRVDDIDLSSYEVMIKELGIKFVFNKKGKIREVHPPGPNHYKMEPGESARQMDQTKELSEILGNTVAQCDRAIKEPEKVYSLTVKIAKRNGIRFESSAGYDVKENAQEYIVTTGTAVENTTLPESEASTFLKEEERYPVAHPDIELLTQAAIEDRVAPEEQVKELISFVSKYVDDVPIHRNQPVIDTLLTQIGDCTEHAELFVTMARSLGIPARTVGGLHYLGGKEFAGHMWCEVVIDGKWIGVDPTLNQYPIDALHIRFTASETQNYANMKAIRNMKIKIVDIKYEDEE